MSRFSESAKHTIGNSPAMEGKTKMLQADLITHFGGVLTLTFFDFIDNGNIVVCNVKEEPTAYFFGGDALKRMCEGFIDDFGDDAAYQLRDDGGVKIRLSKTKTKNGRDFTAVEIIDD